MELRDLVVCPACRSRVQWQEGEILCSGCGARYPIVAGIPLMLLGDREEGRAVWERYDAIAPDYDRWLPPHVAQHYLDKRVRLIARYVRGSTILDVGCGTGRLAKRLLEQGYQVVGADASLGMLRVFQDHTASTPVGAQADRLPFPTESFDGVVCIALLHHLADPEKVEGALGEMYRVTRRKGVLVLWDHNPRNPYWPVLMKRVPQDFGRERLIPLPEILQGLRRAGADSMAVFQMGFVPDFVPPLLLPLMQGVEKLVERTPLLRELAAHNVVVAHKS